MYQRRYKQKIIAPIPNSGAKISPTKLAMAKHFALPIISIAVLPKMATITKKNTATFISFFSLMLFLFVVSLTMEWRFFEKFTYTKKMNKCYTIDIS